MKRHDRRIPALPLLLGAFSLGPLILAFALSPPPAWQTALALTIVATLSACAAKLGFDLARANARIVQLDVFLDGAVDSQARAAETEKALRTANDQLRCALDAARAVLAAVRDAIPPERRRPRLSLPAQIFTIRQRLDVLEGLHVQIDGPVVFADGDGKAKVGILKRRQPPTGLVRMAKGGMRSIPLDQLRAAEAPAPAPEEDRR